MLYPCKFKEYPSTGLRNISFLGEIKHLLVGFLPSNLGQGHKNIVESWNHS